MPFLITTLATRPAINATTKSATTAATIAATTTTAATTTATTTVAQYLSIAPPVDHAFCAITTVQRPATTTAVLPLLTTIVTTKPRALLSRLIRASKGVWGSAAPLVQLILISTYTLGSINGTFFECKKKIDFELPKENCNSEKYVQ